MIPKRIIYCWFGDKEISQFDQNCILSWTHYCPDYEVIRIDESNFDVYQNEFCKEAYEHGNYAFVSDYARLWALKEYGGFYLDTDIELFKSLDELRKYNAIMPLNEKNFYNCAPLGCENFPKIYQEALNRLRGGKCLVSLLNEICHEEYELYGKELEVHDNIAFLGKKYFINNNDHKDYKTIGIHYGNASWLNQWQGGYDKRNTFKAFVVFQNGVRDSEREQKYYGNVERIGVVETKGRAFNFDLVLYGNYFYNEKIQAIVGDGFKMKRFEPKEISEIIHMEGVDLYVGGD